MKGCGCRILAGVLALGLLLESGAAHSENAPSCLAKLDQLPGPAQTRCLRQLSLPELGGLLARADGATDHLLIAATLDVIRGHGAGARPLAETVSSLLPYRSAIYRNRDKQSSGRLRAYLFVTLSDIGVPSSTEPMLVDVLAHIDERMAPVEAGAAARAVGTLGPRGQAFAPYLLRVLSTRISEEEFTLAHFEPRFAQADATTLQIEALRALGKVCDNGDVPVLDALEEFSNRPASAGMDPRATGEARRAFERITAREPGVTPAAGAPDLWITAGNRAATPPLDVAFTDQDGRPRQLDGLLDRPALVVFFYTRCQNDSKCSMTMSHLAFLQRKLAQEGLAGKVRLLAITYEPQYDTPERLNRFATDRGFLPGENALVLRADPARQQQVIDELLAPVSYNAAWVSAHGVESSLLDAQGRLVRKYPTVRWNNDVLVADFRRLMAEAR